MPFIEKEEEFASSNYRTAVRLNDAVSHIMNTIKDKHGLVNKQDLLTLQQMHENLKLKSKVIGYLEGLTKGTSSSLGVSREAMHQFTEWLMTDDPTNPFPVNKYLEAYLRAQWIRGYIAQGDNSTDAKRKVLQSMYLESRQEINLGQVENLVLGGGGAKTLSLVGAIRSLENGQLSGNIKRVAGTSGGAIMAMAYAAGYDSKELESMVLNNNFGLFTLESRFGGKWFSRYFGKAKPEKGTRWHSFVDNGFATCYHKHLMNAFAKQMRVSPHARHAPLQALFLKNPSRNGEWLSEHLKRMPALDTWFKDLVNAFSETELFQIERNARLDALDEYSDPAYSTQMLYSSPKQALVNAMRHRCGQDLIRGFFSDVITEKLKQLPREALLVGLYGEAFSGNKVKKIVDEDLRNINFEQWQRLHELVPDKVKELHISIAITKPIRKMLDKDGFNRYEHFDASHLDDEFKKMPIADAVRVSMNLPVAYRGYKFKLNNIVYKGADGGVRSNVSMETFDKYYDERSTIGVFYKDEKSLESAVSVERLLALPRSRDELKDSIQELEFAEEKLGLEIKKLEKILSDFYRERNATPPGQFVTSGLLEGNATKKLESCRAEQRAIGGILSAYSRELKTLEQEGTPFSRMMNSPLKEFAQKFNKLIDKKSLDELSSSINLRRLVMVNTGAVTTMDFRLTREDKLQQICFGQEAMNSLLSGTYSLENHFYHHRLEGICEKIDGMAEVMGYEPTNLKALFERVTGNWEPHPQNGIKPLGIEPNVAPDVPLESKEETPTRSGPRM